MQIIQLVHAQNKLSKNEGYCLLELEFAVLVQNLAPAKQIAVHWAGDDDNWQVIPAAYHFQAGRDHEQWLAKTSRRLPAAGGWPGHIRFALQYLVAGLEYWDNNHQHNYLLQPDPGLLLGPGMRLLQLSHRPLLALGETALSVRAAAHPSLRPKRVFARWTLDNWQTHRQTDCRLLPADESQPRASWTGNFTEKPGDRVSVWTGTLQTAGAFRVEYAIGCETAAGEVWDNNWGSNYRASHCSLKVLTLNLHCYQEAGQAAKFNEIARAIHELDIDLICLQEVGEEWNNGHGHWPSNAAKIIQDHLRHQGYYYHLYTDWSHRGFEHYREGSAILSKYRFLRQEAAYVSSNQDSHNIHARKVVMAQIHFPYVGLVNVFSVHLSWWEDGFQPQFEKLRQWATEAASAGVVATLLCGDFNNAAGSEGYLLIAEQGYEDQFLGVTSPALFARIFRQSLPAAGKYLTADDRIDFIFTNRGSGLQATSARILFTGQDYRKVSDHLGYLLEFEPREEMASF